MLYDEYSVLHRLGCVLKESTVLQGYGGGRYHIEQGIWKSRAASQETQQTRDAFSFKWNQQETFNSQASLLRMRLWLNERYGDVLPYIEGCARAGDTPLLGDIGCGAAMSALELFGPYLNKLIYVGVDFSNAVNVARSRFLERAREGLFFQEDLFSLPFAPNSFDLLFSEGVLHHTPSTREALGATVPLLRRGGYYFFYVYNKKSPIREFTDDYIRTLIEDMSPAEAWECLKPLTRLGIELGQKDIELDIPEAVPLLGIPAGKISLQRFIYWHILKAFYDATLSLEEMNHINFDWYSPKYALRQTPEEVRSWCSDLGLRIERMVIEPAGITVIAQKQ